MYEEEQERPKPKSLAELMAARPQAEKAKNRSERGDLITYFHSRVLGKNGKPYRISFMATKLSHLSLQDLYYLKSTCDDADRRGTAFGKIFWWSIKAK